MAMATYMHHRRPPGALATSIGSLRGRSASNKLVLTKPRAKCIRQFVVLLFLVMIGIHLWAVLRYVDKAKPYPSRASPPTARRRDEYVMWSKEHAYMRDCQLHYKSNVTWGRLHAPYVDKIEAKAIVERMNVPSLKIIPTLAVLDKQNISNYSLEFMKSLKQPYIIKSSHLSGGVARVYKNIYHCFKYCFNERRVPLGPEAFKMSLNQSMTDIHLDYSTLGGELQYKYITPRIIFEEDLISSGKTNTDVTFWWLSNGHPVFVSEQCRLPPVGNGTEEFKIRRAFGEQGFRMDRMFLATDRRRLPIVFNRGSCDRIPPEPRTWNTQLNTMKELGKEFPGEVVRIDVYAGGDEVWFSEFTYTTAGCWKRFKPAVADGLLYGLMKRKIARHHVTPEYIERMLNDASWVLLSDDPGSSASYPSPVDLCLTFEEFSRKRAEKEMLFDSCIRELKSVRKFPLRCIVSERNGTRLHSFGVDEPSKDAQKNIEVCAAKLSRVDGKANPTWHLPL